MNSSDPEQGGTSGGLEPGSEDPEALKHFYLALKAAARRARRLNPQRTMNTTALVHEAWLRLERGDRAFEDELHYLKTAALAMRQILVDYARYRGAEKRDRAGEIELIESCLPDLGNKPIADWIELDHALSELSKLDPQASDVVHLRFFAGVSNARAADALNISPRSAARCWNRARAYLVDHLQAHPRVPD
ncbi:MAG: ECF-type sigma factor [Pseudomonadota bacterium]